MKKITMFLLFSIILINCSTEQKQAFENFDQFYGVWANENCEMVRTDSYSLFFERNGSVITSTLQKVTLRDQNLHFNTRGIAVFDNDSNTVALRAKDLEKGEEIIIEHRGENAPPLEKRSFSLQNTSGKLLLIENNEIIEELNIKEKSLKIKISNNQWEKLLLIEKLTMTDPYDMPENVSTENIGKRIQEWQLGASKWRDPNGIYWNFHLGTNKHHYTFTVNKDFLYCRAARIRSNNLGAVFAQNIRLVVRGETRDQGYIGYMAKNNLKISGAEIEIDNSMFNAMCGIAYDQDIYWSLNSFKDCEIQVNGCDQIYYRNPVGKDDDHMLEWITYIPY